MIRQLAILGVGLIGGSLARALRQAGYCERIVGYGRNQENLKKAVELGVIDDYFDNPADAVKGADMVVLAVPLGAISSVVAGIAEHLSEDAVLTDVGSAKQSVVDAVTVGFGSPLTQFVPGHPIAGTEQSGVEASFATLFDQRRVILTPMPQSSDQAVDTVRKMWQATGAEVVDMTITHHDDVLAATSHLPHILAYTLVDLLVGMDEKTDVFRFAAGGFRDFTRIASSSPEMWRDICLNNKVAILPILEQYEQALASVRQVIEAENGQQLLELFTRAKTSRDGFVG